MCRQSELTLLVPCSKKSFCQASVTKEKTVMTLCMVMQLLFVGYRIFGGFYHQTWAYWMSTSSSKSTYNCEGKYLGKKCKSISIFEQVETTESKLPTSYCKNFLFLSLSTSSPHFQCSDQSFLVHGTYYFKRLCTGGPALCISGCEP